MTEFPLGIGGTAWAQTLNLNLDWFPCLMDLGAWRCCGQTAGTDRWRARGLSLTGPKDVVDKVDYLLLGDEATSCSEVLLTVLGKGTCDILNTVLREHKLRGTPAPSGPKARLCPIPLGMPQPSPAPSQ